MIPSGWLRIALLLIPYHTIPYHTIPFYSTLFHDNQSHSTNYHVKETSKWVGEIGGAVMSPTCNCAALKLVEFWFRICIVVFVFVPLLYLWVCEIAGAVMSPTSGSGLH